MRYDATNVSLLYLFLHMRQKFRDAEAIILVIRWHPYAGFPIMHLEMSSLTKILATPVAGKRHLSCMTKTLATVDTCKRLLSCMSSFMHQ